MSGVATLKITSLLIKTVSKPIANAIKAQTRQNEFFKKYFVKFGQLVNRADLRLRNNSKVKVRPLNDNKAIEIGSNFLSELFVFSIGATLIFYESLKPKPKEKEPEIPVAPSTSDEGKDNQSLEEKGEEKIDKEKVTEKKKSSQERGTPSTENTQSQATPSQNGVSLEQFTSITEEVNKLKSQNSIILQELEALKKSVNSQNKQADKQAAQKE